MRPFATPQLLVVCGILAFVSISITARAQRGPAQQALAEREQQMRNKPPFPPGVAEGRLVQQMDDDDEDFELDEKTRAALDAAMDELRKEEDAYREKVQAAAKKMNDLLNEGVLDEKAVIEVAKSIGDLGTEMRVRRIAGTVKFRSLLTPDQLKAYMKLREQLPLPRENARRPRR